MTEINLESGNLKAAGRKGKETEKTLLPEGKHQLIGHQALLRPTSATPARVIFTHLHHSIAIHL